MKTINLLIHKMNTMVRYHNKYTELVKCNWCILAKITNISPVWYSFYRNIKKDKILWIEIWLFQYENDNFWQKISNFWPNTYIFLQVLFSKSVLFQPTPQFWLQFYAKITCFRPKMKDVSPKMPFLFEISLAHQNDSFENFWIRFLFFRKVWKWSGYP